MRYLVTFEGVDVGPLLPPEQVAGLIRTTILPSHDVAMRLEEEGKIRGGIVAGARAGAFILEAESNEEANQILQGIPAWGIVKFKLTPLLSFETRREHDQQLLERVEASLQQ